MKTNTWKEIYDRKQKWTSEPMIWTGDQEPSWYPVQSEWYKDYYFPNYHAIDFHWYQFYANWKIAMEYGNPDSLSTTKNFNRYAVANLVTYDDIIQKLFETMSYEYDPIANYDRKEDWTENREPNLTDDTTRVDDLGKVTTHGDTKTNIAPFDSPTYQPREEQIGNGITDPITNVVDMTVTQKGNELVTHHGVTKGNIGVTTTQQMIEQERKVVDFRFWDKAAKLIFEPFCYLLEGSGL